MLATVELRAAQVTEHDGVDAARIKNIHGEVAGRAQILVVPDLEAGNMLAKNLTFLANAEAAGIVVGARVPIVLTSRADSVRSRMASCTYFLGWPGVREKAKVVSMKSLGRLCRGPK